MQRLIMSTNDIPEANRFAYWSEAVSDGLIGVSGERDKNEETPFNAKLEGWVGNSLVHFRYRADRFHVLRQNRDIARRSWEDSYLLYRELSAGAWFNHDRREFITRPDDLVIADAAVPFATDNRASYDHEVWIVPRSLLDPHLPVSRRPRSLVLTGSEGVAGMVKAYLDAFSAQMNALPDGQVGLITDALCRLLAVACGGEAGEQREAIRLARLEDARRYVVLHLADPGLSPDKAAAALKLSVRQLHRLFEPSGMSFAQYTLSRRLEECRSALTSGSGAGRSVTDIALGWGFNSLVTFHRGFRRAYGATPNDLRAAGGGRPLNSSRAR